jgi:hypothetical protein
MLVYPCRSWSCQMPCPVLGRATTPVFRVYRSTVFVSVINHSTTNCSHAGRYSNLRFNCYQLRWLTLCCVRGWLDPGVGVTVRYRPFPLVLQITLVSGIGERSSSEWARSRGQVDLKILALYESAINHLRSYGATGVPNWLYRDVGSGL